MKKSHEAANKKLDILLEKYKKKLSRSIPDLGISIEKIVGEYWIFNPRLFNLSSWWEETINYSKIIHQSIVSYRAHDILLSTLQNENPSISFSSYFKKIQFDRNYHLEKALLRLFAYREKITWIIYELLGHELKPLDYRRVSYSRINRILGQFKGSVSGLSSETVDEIRTILSKFDSESVRKIFEFRHGLTHRTGPRPDQEILPLFIPTGFSTWDTIELGLYRFRYLDHSIVYVWKEFVYLTRSIAQLRLPWIGFRLKIDKTVQQKEHWVDMLHTGIGIHLKEGDLIVRCMKRCRGWWGEMRLHLAFRDMDKKRQNKLIDTITNIFTNIIPMSSGEKKRGKFAFIDITTNDKLNRLFISFSEPVVEKPPESITESTIEIVQKQLDDPSYEYKWASKDESLKASPINKWSNEAKDMWLKYLSGQACSYISNENPIGNKSLSWIIFNTKSHPMRVKKEEGKLKTIILSFEETLGLGRTKKSNNT